MSHPDHHSGPNGRRPAPDRRRRHGAQGGFPVDFLWPERRLIVEIDGYWFHRGAQAFEDDRDRDIKLKLLGFEVARFTHRQVTSDPATVAAAVRALMSRSPR